MEEKKNRRPVALVTGGRQGIGRAIAISLAKANWDLVILDRENDDITQNTLRDLRQYGTHAEFITADISNIETASTVVEDSYDFFGKIDCLVNNAGVQARPHELAIDVLNTSIESFDRLININLRGTFFLTQALAKKMINSDTEKDHFRSIITITSINAEQARTKTPEYCISKAGLSMMNKILSIRLAEHGIACFEVRPGLIETDMTANRHDLLNPLVEKGLSPIRRWGQPEDIGETVATLASGSLPFCTGDVFHVDGGMHISRSALEPLYVRQLLS